MAGSAMKRSTACKERAAIQSRHRIYSQKYLGFPLLKQSPHKFIAREALMRSNASQNGGERAHPERVVVGKGDVMLVT